MKKCKMLVLGLAYVTLNGCGSNGYNSDYIYQVDNEEVYNDVAKNFRTTGCNELGGLEMTTGACFISCTSDSDCEGIVGADHCKGIAAWPVGYCQPSECDDLSGWIDTYGCFMTCDSTDDTSSCPVGFSCLYDTLKYKYYCSGYKKGSGGSNQGVCSGCGYPLCDGRCLGCCN